MSQKYNIIHVYRNKYDVYINVNIYIYNTLHVCKEYYIYVTRFGILSRMSHELNI